MEEHHSSRHTALLRDGVNVSGPKSREMEVSGQKDSWELSAHGRFGSRSAPSLPLLHSHALVCGESHLGRTLQALEEATHEPSPSIGRPDT